MRIHHLNCICACPLGGRLMDGRSPGVLQRGSLCCHCLLIETGSQLVLVDTGYGLRDVENPGARLSRWFLRLMSPDFRAEMTAIRQIERLGFAARDVRHIVLTHLDFDHAGGLDDFPWATVHLMKTEAQDAVAQRTWLDRQRYRPQQWRDRSRWRTYPNGNGQRWSGFECVRDLQGLPPEILMVPLAGHTNGHAGVAVQGADGDMLLAGDAYFYRGEMQARATCTPGLRFYQWMMEMDRGARLGNQDKLRALANDPQASSIRITSSHDPVEFEALAGRAMGQAAGLALG
jgi:glyoxylase-like metal-dependent hydrolase (beta-lactamase superfamily II)